jgi:hypothetical protein
LSLLLFGDRIRISSSTKSWSIFGFSGQPKPTNKINSTMKSSFKTVRRILPMPNAATERYIIQCQYSKGGIIFTMNNNGTGYTLEEAQSAVAQMISGK